MTDAGERIVVQVDPYLKLIPEFLRKWTDDLASFLDRVVVV